MENNIYFPGYGECGSRFTQMPSVLSWDKGPQSLALNCHGMNGLYNETYTTRLSSYTALKNGGIGNE